MQTIKVDRATIPSMPDLPANLASATAFVEKLDKARAGFASLQSRLDAAKTELSEAAGVDAGSVAAEALGLGSDDGKQPRQARIKRRGELETEVADLEAAVAAAPALLKKLLEEAHAGMTPLQRDFVVFQSALQEWVDTIEALSEGLKTNMRSLFPYVDSRAENSVVLQNGLEAGEVETLIEMARVVRSGEQSLQRLERLLRELD